MLKHVWIDERKILTRVQRHYRGDLDLDVLANLLPDQPVPLDEPILPRLSSEEKEFLVEQQRARLININSEL
jgi:hypothetical protein